MRVSSLIIFLSLLIGLAGRSAAADLVLSGATVYPAPEATPIVDAVIVITDGKIAAVGPRATATWPKGARQVDCTGKFITAGFWNSHVHLLTPALLEARTATDAELAPQFDAMFNRWGFTTIFDIASPLANTAALRERVVRGTLRGPRILTTGDPLWTRVPVYVGAYLASHGIEIPPVTTPENAAARVQTLAEHGVSGIKLFTGSVQQGAVAHMPLDTVRAAASEAHARRLPVFAHPQDTAGLEAAITGGVDILAHPSPGSPPWTPEMVARLTKARMALIPTLTLFEVEGEKMRLPPAELEQLLSIGIDQLRVFSAAGGEVLFGTDIGYIERYDTTRELQLMARAGLDFPRVLASLTTAPAARFGFGGRSGRIAVGFEADLVILERDPAADLTALAQVRATIRHGEFTYETK